MTMPGDRYAPRSEADVTRLVVENPLAWVVSMVGDDWRATPLPLRPEGSVGEEPIRALLGHFARSNGHLDLIRRKPQAMLLFTGVNGYISPSWMHDRTQAPTWNYATVQYLVDIQLVEAKAEERAVLDAQVDAMEAGRPNAWSAGEMGARYDSLAKRIVAFRAVVRERRVKFKLGQDERRDEYLDIMAALEPEGHSDLHRWMAQANAGRLDGD